ncbi:MAG: trypsin-like peptidase domain-containing protein [Pirellulaceae bacterium]|nr:trypsin-like peptidase domain-containing protein [Pirellulaceae bacterium]
MSDVDPRPTPPRTRPPANSFRPNRAEILAGLSIVFALLSLLWSSGNASRMDSPTPARELGEAPPATRLPSSPTVSPSGITLDDISAASAQLSARAVLSVVRVESSFKGRSAPSDDLETYFGSLPPESIGSGFVVDTQGHVLTNYHVVRGADSVSIRDSSHQSLPATVVGYDSLTDLALLKIPNLKLPALSFGNSRQLATGQLVWAIGSPHGLDQSVAMGIISSVDRPTLLDSPFQDFLQTDASINPGSSGGPLLDTHGEVIGINTATSGQNFSGIGFALPSNMAKQVLEQLRDQGEVPRGWIGVQLSAVTPARAAVAGLERADGAYVESLASGDSSPAQQAGLRVADICTKFQDQPVTGPLGLIRQIAGHTIDTTAKLTVMRNGQVLDLKVTVQRRP